MTESKSKGPNGENGNVASGTEHERGQRHGAIESCDYDGCDSTEFNIVRDELTDKRLVVCEDCGFTMGWL